MEMASRAPLSVPSSTVSFPGPKQAAVMRRLPPSERCSPWLETSCGVGAVGEVLELDVVRVDLDNGRGGVCAAEEDAVRLGAREHGQRGRDDGVVGGLRAVLLLIADSNDCGLAGEGEHARLAHEEGGAQVGG